MTRKELDPIPAEAAPEAASSRSSVATHRRGERARTHEWPARPEGRM